MTLELLGSGIAHVLDGEHTGAVTMHYCSLCARHNPQVSRDGENNCEHKMALFHAVVTAAKH